MRNFLYYARENDQNAMAREVLDNLSKGNLEKAASQSMLLDSRFGLRKSELKALCAAVLAKAGCYDAAMECFDTLIDNEPCEIKYIEAAINAAWEGKGNAPEASKWVEKWVGILSRIYIETPSFAFLKKLADKGYKLNGVSGIYDRYFYAWFTLPNDQKPVFNADFPGKLPIQLFINGKDNSTSLYKAKVQLQDANKPYNIVVASQDGNKICCSGLCFPSKLESVKQTKKNADITVIIPVYDGREVTLGCIASVLASQKFNKTSFAILVIWDHGPDEKLYADLVRLASTGKIILKQTPRNFGYLGAVNHALTFVPQGDVILLNSDTITHGDWVDRMGAAAKTKDAATITAMGSEAEAQSFPSYGDRCSISKLSEAAVIDNAANQLTTDESLIETTVGCGFCMLLCRRALNTIGRLDGFRVYKGYGEESDFCLRAKEKGFKNYGIYNVFVAHLQGKSFGAGKRALAAQNNKALRKRFPEYSETFKQELADNYSAKPRQKISEILAQGSENLPPLQILPCSASCMPQWSERLQDKPDNRWASLFLLPYNKNFGRSLLRIRGDVPFADMQFNLPEDDEKLRLLLSHFPVIYACPSNKVINDFFSRFHLPMKNPTIPEKLDSIPKDKKCLKSRNFIAQPPQTPAELGKLRKFANYAHECVIYVANLKKFTGGAPLPLNILELPSGKDLRPLQLAAFIATVPIINKDYWQNWLREKHVDNIPFYTLADA